MREQSPSLDKAKLKGAVHGRRAEHGEAGSSSGNIPLLKGPVQASAPNSPVMKGGEFRMNPSLYWARSKYDIATLIPS